MSNACRTHLPVPYGRGEHFPSPPSGKPRWSYIFIPFLFVGVTISSDRRDVCARSTQEDDISSHPSSHALEGDENRQGGEGEVCENGSVQKGNKTYVMLYLWDENRADYACIRC